MSYQNLINHMEPLVKEWWYSLPREKTFPFSRPDRWEEIPEVSKEAIFGFWIDHLTHAGFSIPKDFRFLPKIDAITENWMSEPNIKESAEAHWKYTEGIINLCLEWKHEGGVPIYRDMDTEEWIEVCHYLYVQAMVHGYKHGRDDS